MRYSNVILGLSSPKGLALHLINQYCHDVTLEHVRTLYIKFNWLPPVMEGDQNQKEDGKTGVYEKLRIKILS